jgi:hypothetical protein
MKSNHVDEYVSSGTSPTCPKVSKKNQLVPFAVLFPIDPLQILRLAELAERLKVSERFINPLLCILIGRYLRFDWLDVSAWLRRQSERAA